MRSWAPSPIASLDFTTGDDVFLLTAVYLGLALRQVLVSAWDLKTHGDVYWRSPCFAGGPRTSMKDPAYMQVSVLDYRVFAETNLGIGDVVYPTTRLRRG